MSQISYINLNDFGLKETPARLHLLAFLLDEKRPVDVTQIMTHLKNHEISVDKVTVYRILDIFCTKGIVVRLELQEGKFRYELNLTDHHHFICEQCGEITEIPGCPVEKLENDLSKDKKFHITRHALEFFGICQYCQSL